MKKISLRFSFAIIGIALMSLTVNAQFSPGVFAITDARIVRVSAGPIERGTVVIRDGLIESVGTNVSVPADAVRIDGSGLSVYPGFFDAYTNLGLPPAVRPAASGAQAADESNSNYPDGLRPEDLAFSKLRSGDAQFEAQRNTGITTALTVGDDGIFNGQSAIINLAGDSVSAMTIRSVFAQHVTFRALRNGQYPTSLMGTFSALRQMFLDAQRLIELRKIYAANPLGMPRPEADTSLEALIPVVTGQMTVVFNANSEREINRALNLVQEFKLKAIIAGGQEAWKVADRLKAQDVPVLISLNFPIRTAASSKEDDPETMETLRLRIETPKNPARLRQAGVRFAFQSGGLKNIGRDFLGNAVKATENGLSRDDALRALTMSAAEILGVDHLLGSVDTGKIANLVVSRGDIFDKDKQITHVFVDGRLFEQKEKPKPKTPAAGADAGAARNIGGSYAIVLEIPGMPTNATLNLTQQASVLSGSMVTPFGTSQIRDGTVTANGFSFATTVDFEGQTFDIIFSGTTSGDQIEGTIQTPQGPITFSGTKTP